MIFVALALAGPGQSGTLLPGARPLPSIGYVGVGGIVANVEERGQAAGGLLDFGVGGDLAVVGHVHSWGITDGRRGSIGALALRGQLLDRSHIRLAGFVGAALVKDGRLHFVPALATEIGDPDKLLFDLTLMPYSIGYRVGDLAWSDQVPRGRWTLGAPDDPRWTHGGILPLGTLGVAVPLPFGDNRIRFGFPELVAWHHVGERLWFDAGGILFGATLGPHFKIGMLLGKDPPSPPRPPGTASPDPPPAAPPEGPLPPRPGDARR